MTQIGTRVSSLEVIKETFGNICRIYKKPGVSGVMVYEVMKLKDLHKTVIPFLEKYNYFSARKEELIVFKNVVNKILLKKHLDTKGLK